VPASGSCVRPSSYRRCAQAWRGFGLSQITRAGDCAPGLDYADIVIDVLLFRTCDGGPPVAGRAASRFRTLLKPSVRYAAVERVLLDGRPIASSTNLTAQVPLSALER
jgi:hypothetical protein